MSLLEELEAEVLNIEVIAMKIDGVNPANFNPYRNQPKLPQPKAEAKTHDQLEISPEAQQMQKQSKWTMQRQDKVQALKSRIEAGNYQLDPQKSADKFYEFWKDQ